MVNELGLNEWNMEDEILNGSPKTKQNTTIEITNFNEKNEMETNFETLRT
jgi:hypothetical protein